MMMLSDAPDRFKSFLACPISQYLGADGRLRLPREFDTFIRTLFSMLRAETDEVFLALERERWGEQLMAGTVCTPLDFAEMERCDIVVAYPGGSAGVAVELGWASALRKPIILLLDRSASYTPMIRELGQLPEARVDIIEVEHVNGEPTLSMLDVIAKAVRNVRTRWETTRVSGRDSTAGTAFHSHGMLGSWLIGREEEAEVHEVIRSRSLFRHYGPALLHKTSSFEELFAATVGSAHTIAVSSGTAALRCALHALEVGPGDEVIVPACTFVATANAVVLAGATPVFAEVDEGLGLDPARLAERITSRTKVIIGVHLQGQTCRIREIAAIARQHSVALVEDAAQAFGCTYESRHAGTFGDIGIYSLQAHKTITCGEGGVLVTNDAALYGKARRFQDQGGERNLDDYPSWDHPQAGFGENLKMNELQAAVALAQLKKLPRIREAMQRVDDEVSRRCPIGNRTRRASFDPAGAIPYSFIFFALDSRDRTRILRQLAAAGVPADSAYSEPVYRLSPLVRWSRGERVAGAPRDVRPSFEPCPFSESLLERMVRIPYSPMYGATEVDCIADAVSAAMEVEAPS